MHFTNETPIRSTYLQNLCLLQNFKGKLSKMVEERRKTGTTKKRSIILDQTKESSDTVRAHSKLSTRSAVFSPPSIGYLSELSFVNDFMGLHQGLKNSIIPSKLADILTTEKRPESVKPPSKSQLVVESINSLPIVKNRRKTRRNPRQSISSLSPSQQQEICKQSLEKMSERDNFRDKPRSLKKIRLWNLLSIGEKNVG